MLRSGWLTMGPRTAEFEARSRSTWACGMRWRCPRCTAALHLAYLAAGVGPGDEVIVPAMTFAATAAAVVYCGGTPVFADIVGPHDLSLDPGDVGGEDHAAHEGGLRRALRGYSGGGRRLRELCDAHGLALIEDAAHAPMATRATAASLGTFGLAGAFSFFSNKVLACGEGGLLATDDDEVAALARSRRSQAMTSRDVGPPPGATRPYDAVGLGFNYRLDEPRAALLFAAAAAARRRRAPARAHAPLPRLLAASPA